MEEVYVVICDDCAVVMGVYSHIDNAIACRDYYQDKFPNETYSNHFGDYKMVELCHVQI